MVLHPGRLYVVLECRPQLLQFLCRLWIEILPVPSIVASQSFDVL